MITIRATVPCLEPPAWAVWERRLLEEMSASVMFFLQKYTKPDGELIWRDVWPDSIGPDGEEDFTLHIRDGVDDFYESFYNWPLLYLLGGSNELLELSHRQWDATTRLLTRLGPVFKEYERGYDQFHQSEHYTYFYFLCLADPDNPKLLERAQRFAGFFTGEDPETPNYDPQHRILRAPHTGSGGPRWGYDDRANFAYPNIPGMRPYGLPIEGISGINTYDDLADPRLARLMGQTMQERLGKGDTANNLLASSLVSNAFLLTGEEKYRQWVLEYVGAWRARAEANGGLIPDNVGLSGQVGEYFDGRWFGGHYGWTWPHGYYSLAMSTTVAGSNAFLLSSDPSYLEMPRQMMEKMHSLGEHRSAAELRQGTLAHHWIGQLAGLKDSDPVFAIPYRYGLNGWFDYSPISPNYALSLWNLSQTSSDARRVEWIRQHDTVDWKRTLAFRTKEDSGHEQPWWMFLHGQNPGYPETILSKSYGVVNRRLDMIRADQDDLTKVNIHHWQQLNPVTTEALVQLTLGAPQPLYNGGLLQVSLRYFDAERQRPGLPQDVAALVEAVTETTVKVCLINLSLLEPRILVVQAGGFGEHRFEAVRFEQLEGDYPGKPAVPVIDPADYGGTQVETVSVEQTLGESLLQVELLPGTEVRLELTLTRHVNQPSYTAPWNAVARS